VFLVVLVVWPVLEIAFAIAVASQIGWWLTLGLIVVSSVVGWLVLRSSWRRGRTSFREVRAGREPTTRAGDESLRAFGGLLLLVPGLLSSVVGALLQLPPVRHFAAIVVSATALRRFTVITASVGAARNLRGMRRRTADVVRGEVSAEDSPASGHQDVTSRPPELPPG
jgi:UPF0716 protein FxsA